MTKHKKYNAIITGLGMYFPDKVLDNAYFEKIVDTTDEWIRTRTGIVERRMLENGATTVLLEPTEDLNYGLQDSILRVDGSGREALYMKGGGSLYPSTHKTVDNNMHVIYQDGKAVFKVAVKGMADVSYEIMQKNNLNPEDIAYLVPHQANLRIIDATAERMGISKDKVMINIHKYGNTTAATIPSCLVEYYRDGKLKKGDKIILASFGAGFTFGASYLVWG